MRVDERAVERWSEENDRAGERTMGSEWTGERGSDRAGSGGARRADEKAMGNEIARSESARGASEMYM